MTLCTRGPSGARPPTERFNLSLRLIDIQPQMGCARRGMDGDAGSQGERWVWASWRLWGPFVPQCWLCFSDDAAREKIIESRRKKELCYTTREARREEQTCTLHPKRRLVLFLSFRSVWCCFCVLSLFIHLTVSLRRLSEDFQLEQFWVEWSLAADRFTGFRSFTHMRSPQARITFCNDANVCPINYFLPTVVLTSRL